MRRSFRIQLHCQIDSVMIHFIQCMVSVYTCMELRILQKRKPIIWHLHNHYLLPPLPKTVLATGTTTAINANRTQMDTGRIMHVNVNMCIIDEMCFSLFCSSYCGPNYQKISKRKQMTSKWMIFKSNDNSLSLSFPFHSV